MAGQERSPQALVGNDWSQPVEPLQLRLHLQATASAAARRSTGEADVADTRPHPPAGASEPAVVPLDDLDTIDQPDDRDQPNDAKSRPHTSHDNGATRSEPASRTNNANGPPAGRSLWTASDSRGLSAAHVTEERMLAPAQPVPEGGWRRAIHRATGGLITPRPSPGTGKSRLVEGLLQDAQREPTEFGLDAPPSALWVTPDENWSVRDFVGGDTVDEDGRIVFAPGHLLRAIAADEQLVIDELNRADMDRIFGAALTFLAGQEVVAGRESHEPDAAEIRLRWGPGARSGIAEKRSSREGSKPAIVYEAGSDFRILGTYNGVDAHQVFRLGQALGRRFQQIPIAPAGVERFDSLLQDRLDLVDPDDRRRVADTVLALYESHLLVFEGLVPTASFLDIPGHVAASDGDLIERLTEAYLATAGGWLARQEPNGLDLLGRTLVEQEALTESEWLWAQQFLRLLA